MNLIKHIQERHKATGEEIGRRARAEAEMRGERPAYPFAPNRRARRRRYWK